MMCVAFLTIAGHADADNSSAAATKSKSRQTTTAKKRPEEPVPAKARSGSTKKNHAASPSAAGKTTKSNSTGVAHNARVQPASSRKNLKKKKKTVRGQQKIEPERAQAIQEALIREHYMTGEPTGTWNQESEDAMRKYQADHGWQAKTVPDSRALISLGLGPSHDHLLNPESAMTSGPDVSHSASMSSSSQIPASHTADPGSGLIPGPSGQAPSTSSDHESSVPQ